MITWKQEGSTWVGSLNNRKLFECVALAGMFKGYFVSTFRYNGLYWRSEARITFPEAKQAAEDFAAEMKQLFNTKEL